MASTYTSDIKIELIGTGDQAGSWGSTTNQNWDRVDEAISSYAVIPTTYSATTRSWLLDDTTAAFTDATTSVTGSSGRAAFVEFTDSGGTRVADLAVTIQGSAGAYPRRVFFARNSLTGGYDIVFNAGGAEADEIFTLKNGATAIVYTKLDADTAENVVGNVFSTLQIDNALVGTGSASGTVTTNGAQNLVLSTNEGTTSGTVEINDGTNGNIDIDPHGSGDVRLFAGGGTGQLTLDSNDIESVGTLTATSLAGTLTTVAQTNVTSLGTLTALQVDNININLNTISSDAGTDLNITPLAGQQIVLDGTIVIDAGVVTGATSITSTDFVGDLTGDVDGDVEGNVTGNVTGSSGSCTGNSATATLASTVTVTDSSADTAFPVTFHDESNALLDDTGAFTYNPNDSEVTATTFVGALTGNASGSSASCTGNSATATTATNVTVAAESSDIECFPLFTTADSGNLPPMTGANLKYNSNTSILTVPFISGATTITATSVTGTNGTFTNLTGTLATASQSSITGVGDVTSGSWDAAIHGTGSLGTANIAMGSNSGTNLASGGNQNVFIGDESGNDVTTGDGNICIGYQAADKITVSNNNVAIGRQAFGAAASGSASDVTNSVGIGGYVLTNLTTGTENTAVGGSAGGVVTTGDYNVCIGRSTDTSTGSASNEIVIGHNIAGVADKVCFGKSGNVLSADYTGEGTTTWSATSDINIKKNIDPETIGLSLINKLNPVQFNFKGVDDLSDEEDVYVDYVSSKSSKRFHGFIAQEVEEAAQSVGIESLDGLYVDAKGVYQFGATAFIQPMVKAIQELSSKIGSLESRLAALE